MLGAYLFGGVTILQFHAQALGLEVPNELLSAFAIYRNHCRLSPHFTRQEVIETQFTSITR